MSSLEDEMIELEVRDSWWDQGEAVMREMCEDDDAEYKFYDNLCNKMKGNDGEKGLQSRED